MYLILFIFGRRRRPIFKHVFIKEIKAIRFGKSCEIKVASCQLAKLRVEIAEKLRDKSCELPTRNFASWELRVEILKKKGLAHTTTDRILAELISGRHSVLSRKVWSYYSLNRHNYPFQCHILGYKSVL